MYKQPNVVLIITKYMQGMNSTLITYFSIKKANLLRMIMSYHTCHDVTSNSPHAVVNDVCLRYYLDNEPSYQVSHATKLW